MAAYYTISLVILSSEYAANLAHFSFYVPILTLRSRLRNFLDASANDNFMDPSYATRGSNYKSICLSYIPSNCASHTHVVMPF